MTSGKEHKEFTAHFSLCKRVNEDACILLSAKPRVFIPFSFDSTHMIALKYFYFFVFAPLQARSQKLFLATKKNPIWICFSLEPPKLSLWAYQT